MIRAVEEDGFTPRRWVWLAIYGTFAFSVAMLMVAIFLLGYSIAN